MKTQLPQLVDSRRAQQIVPQILARRLGYLPNWQPPEKGTDAALLWIYARYLEAILRRLNQAPDKNKLAFFDLLGVDLIPAQAARAPIVFKLSEGAADTRAPKGTQVVAPPPPEGSDQIVFETEQAVGLSAASLQEIVSLWPGRDQYIDHSDDFAAGTPFRPFQKRLLQDTPHHIYIAHDTLLALAGSARVNVAFELTQTSSERLDIVWEYWDGEVWRGFKEMHPVCQEDTAEKPDSTNGLTQSGRFLLESDCAEAVKTTVNGVEAFWIRGVLNEPLPPDPAQILPLAESIKLYTEILHPLDPPVTQVAGKAALRKGGGASFLAQAAADDGNDEIVVSGLEPDGALFGVETLDTSQSFYPLGQAPVPGDTFYFASEEIFTKPGAEVTVYLELAETPYDDLTIVASGVNPTSLQPKLKWEYWNGRQWRDLAVTAVASIGNGLPANFEGDGAFKFTVRSDMSKTEVNGEEAYWVRARLAGGGFGFKATVSWSIGTSNGTNSYTYVINQPPALANFRLGYTWQHGPFHPEKVFTYNDFQYRDHTEDAKWPGRYFQPFQLLRDVTPALYLGFSDKLPVDRLNLFIDIEEEPGETKGPALVWEYWDGFNWRALSVTDETNHLRVPGMLSLIGAQDAGSLARFKAPLYWLRGRLKEDGPPGAPTCNAVHLNAVWASQQQTVLDEPIGTSNGRPNQVFTFRQIPILAGETIDVRELAGARANVEWRILAMEILGEDYGIVQQIEDELRQEGANVEVQKGDLRLKRDRHKRVTEAWVRWHGQKHLFFSGPDDRHYLIEPNQGRLIFGDGQRGKVPPPGAAIIARQYRAGGGLAGNVVARSINQLLAGIGSVEEVFNPKPAEGGANGETLDSLASRGPLTLRHRGRALSPRDYETMAQEASPAVAVARAIPTRDENGRCRAGWVTLIIIPQSNDARPWPSFGLREHVRRAINARAPASIAAAGQLIVTGPDYQEVDVTAAIAPKDPTEAGAVEQEARLALEAFFHPLRGGPEGRGWQPGRAVYQSDVASVLERVDGVDYVRELSLVSNGALQGERARVYGDRIAVAGQISIRMEGGE